MKIHFFLSVVDMHVDSEDSSADLLVTGEVGTSIIKLRSKQPM